jgi:hypothetical protein
LAPAQTAPSPDELAALVVDLVALANGPVDPALIAPAALMLREEGLMALPEVTFGCNYNLDVLSFELSRGFTRAVDGGALVLKSGRVSCSSYASPTPASADARKRSQELLALTRMELMVAARHHLLREPAG